MNWSYYSYSSEEVNNLKSKSGVFQFWLRLLLVCCTSSLQQSTSQYFLVGYNLQYEHTEYDLMHKSNPLS